MACCTLCWMWHVRYLLITIAVIHSVSGLTFARKSAHISLAANFPLNLPFWKVVAILDDDSTSSGRVVNYRIRRITWHIAKSKTKHATNERFIIDSAGFISLAVPLGDIFNTTGHSKITFIIEVSGEDKGIDDTTIVTVSVHAENNSVCRPRSNICFPSPDVNYHVPESLQPGVIFDTLRPRTVCDKLQFEYQVSEGNDFISVHPTLGEVALTNSQDAEVIMDRQFKILCHLSNGKKQEMYSMSGILDVEDVDDNPPYLQPGAQSVFYINVADINPGRPLPIHLTILDKDSEAVNNVDVRIQNDTLSLLEVQDISVFEDAFENSMLFHAEIAAIQHFYFPGQWYNFSVVFEDVSLSNSSERKVVFHVHIRNMTALQRDILQQRSVRNVTVYHHASLHSRVFQPVKVAEKDGFAFRLKSHNTTETVFKITEKTGIIYVANRAALLALDETEMYLTVTWSTPLSKKGECLLIVNVSRADIEPALPDCAFSSCSKSGEKEECNLSCGRGAATARCQWRTNKRFDVPTSHYATCSPDLETCPDGYCDELESMDKWICPQDCTKRVNGQGILDSTSGRGIDRAVGPCTCPEPSTCTCTNHIPVTNNSLEIESRGMLSHRGSTKTPYLVTWSHFPNENRMGLKESGILFFGGVTSTTACGKGCVAFIFLGVSCSFIGCVVFVLFCRMKKYGNKQKFFGSRISLSAQPTDCVIDDRSSSILDSQAASDCSSSKGLYDAKWEFPRENLLFEKVLGEGEFGKVMRAQAWGIDGSQEYKTVAVKMLKGNGTAAEYQDLLSEFQLLRDIVHPNVIRLLGACTQKGGPLYVIVEYAELGSLRSYLRQCRSLEYDSNSLANPCYDSGYGPADVERSPVDMPHLTQKDLFSFSWQISKGMAYLSDMKLVHRDLAARNILIASGMVIKISDFGLSRDVYEGDTYLKKSKGPVPVKWMAIESLEDHIYTTRSDVWAFGIVLWEIVTLGASPYPGIVPERLFHLLKAGYRMEQPRNCPDDLYRVMRSCWRDSPHDRPSFKDLVQKFDTMLQDMTSYMDFTQESCDTLQSLTSSTSFKDDDTRDEMYGQIKLHNYLGPKKTEQLNYTNCHCSWSSSDESRVMDAIV